jgi:hypothetical protein
MQAQFLLTEIKLFIISSSVDSDALCKVKGKSKSKVHPRTGHESPEGK